MTGIRIFSGRSNPKFAEQISQYLGVPLGERVLADFPDGEIQLKLADDVRGSDAFIVQATCPPVNTNLIELLICIDAMKRSSARRITAVMPYFGYARQDRKDEGRVPITAKLVANLLTVAGASRVLTLDLHAHQIQGFFDIPVDNLSAEPVFSAHLPKMVEGPLTLVSPDVGNVKRARVYASRLGGELAIIDKQRVSGAEIKPMNIIGDVKDKTVLMVDDMISTGGTVAKASELVRRHGARQIIVAATHAVFARDAAEVLANAPIDHISVTDTIPIQPHVRERLPNLTVLSVSELMGEAIRRIHRHESVSSLFMK
ncbi:MAG: ribose-phosphate pyrophosphokinase [Planctomycetota bacterium]